MTNPRRITSWVFDLAVNRRVGDAVYSVVWGGPYWEIDGGFRGLSWSARRFVVSRAVISEPLHPALEDFLKEAGHVSW